MTDVSMILHRDDCTSPSNTRRVRGSKSGDLARRYLARLVESGRLERTGRGRYSLPNPMSPLSLPSHSDDEEPPEGTNGTDGIVACGVCGGPNDPERDLLGADCLACYTRSHP